MTTIILVGVLALFIVTAGYWTKRRFSSPRASGPGTTYPTEGRHFRRRDLRSGFPTEQYHYRHDAEDLAAAWSHSEYGEPSRRWRRAFSRSLVKYRSKLHESAESKAA